MGYKYRYVAKSINDYLDIIKKIQATNSNYSNYLWYRGQSNSEHRLVPKGLRETYPVMNSYGYKINQHSTGYGDTHVGPSIEEMLNKFKQKAIPYLNYIPRNDFEWMFIAQHYGLPTRLLDWTENPLVALYFSMPDSISNIDRDDFTSSINEDVEDYFLNSNEYSSGGAAVHVMDPSIINHKSVNVSAPIDISVQFEKWESYVNPTMHGVDSFLPIAVIGNHIDQRIRAQSGHFTLHGYNLWPLDYYNSFEDVIHKIFFPYNVIESIKEELKLVGITSSFIFQDVSSVAKDIMEDENIRFYRRYNSGAIYIGIDEREK